MTCNARIAPPDVLIACGTSWRLKAYLINRGRDPISSSSLAAVSHPATGRCARLVQRQDEEVSGANGESWAAFVRRLVGCGGLYAPGRSRAPVRS